MFSAKTRLITFSVLTALLMLTAVLLMRSQRAALEPSPAPDAAPERVERTQGAEQTEAEARGASLARAGMRAYEMGDAQSAVRLFERALELSPSNAEWRLWLERARLEVEARRRRAGAEDEPQAPAEPAPNASAPSDTSPAPGAPPSNASGPSNGSPEPKAPVRGVPTREAPTPSDAPPSNGVRDPS